MAKIMFLGGEGTGDPRYNQWGRFRFELNKWVECDDPQIVAKASINRFFKVEHGDGKPADDPPPLPEAPVVKLDPLARARAAKAAKRAADKGDAA